jgi:hypothetical protein
MCNAAIKPNMVMNEAEKQKVESVRDLTKVEYVLRQNEEAKHDLMLKLRAKQQLRGIQGRRLPRTF